MNMNMNIKSVMLAVGLVLPMSLATNVKAETITALEYCKTFEGIAESVMKARQNEIAISDLLTVVNKHLETEPNTKNIAGVMVLDAYDKPSFRTEEYKQRSIREFKNAWFKECVMNLDQFKP